MSASNVVTFDIYSPTNPAIKVTVKALEISDTHIQISNVDASPEYNAFVLNNDNARFDFKIPSKISLAAFLAIINSSGSFSVDKNGQNQSHGLIQFSVLVLDTLNGTSPVVGATVTYGNGDPVETDDNGLALVTATEFGALTIEKTGHIPYSNPTFKPGSATLPYQFDLAATNISFVVLITDDLQSPIEGASVTYNNGTPVLTDVNGLATIEAGGIYSASLLITKASFDSDNINNFIPLDEYTEDSPYTVQLTAS